MSVKNAVDYYNSSDIQVGNIVIIDDSRPQSCEDGRIAVPYTRLRVRALEVAPYSDCGEVRAQLETEQESILLSHNVSLLNMHGQSMLKKADDWLESTEAAHNLAQKRSKVFGKLNSKQLLTSVMFLCVILLIAAICWVMRMESTSVPVTSEVVLRIALGAVIGVSAGAVIANVLIPRTNVMEDAQKRAAELDEQLRLYHKENSDSTDVIAIDPERG